LAINHVRSPNKLVPAEEHSYVQHPLLQ
jgi:hypothetical protein